MASPEKHVQQRERSPTSTPLTNTALPGQSLNSPRKEDVPREETLLLKLLSSNNSTPGTLVRVRPAVDNLPRERRLKKVNPAPASGDLGRLRQSHSHHSLTGDLVHVKSPHTNNHSLQPKSLKENLQRKHIDTGNFQRMASPPVKSPPLYKTVEEGRSEIDWGYMWDSGFGAYVPRSSVPQPKVYVRVVFLKIGEIDTLKELFRAEVFVQARWREPALDHCHNVEDIQWHALWNPQLQLENAMDDPRSSVWHDLTVSDNGEAYVLEKRRVKADFAESLELQSFPFDVQHLSILITSRLSDACLELLEDDSELSSVNLLSFVDEQEWDVRDIVEAIPEIRSREFSSVKHKFPIITVRTYAIRRAGYFVWNVLAVMVLICSLSLCTFAVDRKLPQNRLQLSFTLVLTGVAFKFVVGQSLPKIPYLTVLDKYILGSMVLMHVVSVWHAIITRIENNPELAKTMDEWAFVILVLVFGFYNVAFAVIMVIKIYMKRKFVAVLETAYQAKVQRQMSQNGESTQRSLVKKSRPMYNNSRVHTL